MTLLSRYLLRQALFFVGVCLGGGIGIYLLVDLFSRISDFFEAGMGLGTIGLYFLAKVPLILSQAMPSIVLLALVLMLSFMQRSRETLALESGGISPLILTRFLIGFGLALFLLQLFFSQFIAIRGERMANAIWNEHVRQWSLNTRGVDNLWFKDGPKTVSIGKYWPGDRRGERLVVYYLADDFQEVVKILEAQQFFVSGSEWELQNVIERQPGSYAISKQERAGLQVDQNMEALMATAETKDDGTSFDPVSLPLWQLGSYIRELERSGSNVERLKTSWHIKWAYSFSLVIMVLLAFSITSMFENLYLNVGIGLVSIFIFYVVFISGTTAAQEGYIPPWLGAWAGNFLLGGAVGFRMIVLGRLR